MDEYKLEPVDNMALDRCQGTHKSYQCKFRAYPGTEYCTMHGAAGARKAMEASKVHDYQIKQYQNRIDSLAGSGNIKNLAGEIAILRMTLEAFMNTITEPTHWMISIDKVANLTDKIHRIVMDIQKLDEKTGQMLSKDALMTIADVIIAVIAKHVSDPDALLALSTEIPEAINAAGSGTTVLERLK